MRDAAFLHSLVKNNFLAKQGFLLDFNQPLPTKDDIRERFPNYMGWFTPIENGAFFTGLYLYGLLDSRKAREAYAADIRALKDALCALQDAATVPGFVPRGLAEDGVSHYPFSSDDQVGPFLLGLWKYRNSDLCGENERRDVDKRIMTVIDSAKEHDYRYVTEIPGVLRYGCGAGKTWRDTMQRLFLPFVAYRITLDKAWLDDYRAALSEKVCGAMLMRKDIANAGFAPDMIEQTSLIQFWIFVSSHLMQKELAFYDEDLRAIYEEGLRHNGFAALPHTKRFENMGDFSSIPFGNWRDIEKLYDAERNHRDPNAYGSEQGCVLGSVLPGRAPEHTEFAGAVFSAWICAKSMNEAAAAEAEKQMRKLLANVEIEKMRMCYAFAAECSALALGVE